jgi:hypothetical protein
MPARTSLCRVAGWTSLLFVLLALCGSGCSGTPSSQGPDPDALKREAEQLRKMNEREAKNK